MANAKTLRKRIALVAAAAVGVGVLAAAPAFAAVIAQAPADVTSISLAQVTAAPTINAAVTVNVGAVTVGQAVTSPDTVAAAFTGYLSSYPAGGFTQVSAVATATGTTTVLSNTANTVSGATLTATSPGTTVTAFGNTVAASATSGFGSFTFTPTVAGTYTLTTWNDANKDGVVNIGEAVQTINITVAGATAYSPSLSTAYINGAIAAPSSSTDLVAVSASKALPAAQAAVITVTLKNTAGGAMNGETISATVSGPGTLGINATPGTYNPASTGRALTQALGASNNIGNVSVWSDGTAGVSTITISVTDAVSGATTVLATKTVTFYGAVASLKVISQNYFVGKAGGGTSGLTTGLSASSDTPAVTVAALDANGNVVPGQTITGLSSNTAIIASSTVAEDTAGNDATGFYGGPGYYNASVTTAGLTTSGQSATVTYRYTPDGGLTYISAPAVTFTLGGTPASVTFALDSATYAPGAKATLTVTAKDSAGNPVADGNYANLLAAAASSNAATQGTLPGVSVTTSKGVKSYTFYAPVSPVAFTITGTLGTSVALAAQGTTVSASATVKAAPVDTTAIDAATAAAKAASAAVAALSVTVASLIASVTAQLRALTIIVKKIQSKLKIK